MSEKRIAVIGDIDSVLAFKSVGIEVIEPHGREEIENTIRRLAKEEYALILITEDKAAIASELIFDYKSKAYPIILPLPRGSGSSGFGIKGLRYNIEKAIGMDIVFNKEEEE